MDRVSARPSGPLGEGVALSSGEDWPPPVEVINEHGRSPFVLVCEHASNHIPHEYARLGLRASNLEEHIAWDIGAAEVTRLLAERLDAPAFLGTYSRLLIDLNRPLRSETSIPVRSEATDIPGNIGLGDAERRRRAERIFAPFHERIETHLDARAAGGRRTVILAIHSFVPVFLGELRRWHAGVLFGKATSLGEHALAGLGRDPNLIVGANVPYSITDDGDYTVPVHGDRREIPALLFEIRHDLIRDGSGVLEWTDRLIAAVAAWEDA